VTRPHGLSYEVRLCDPGNDHGPGEDPPTLISAPSRRPKRSRAAAMSRPGVSGSALSATIQAALSAAAFAFRHLPGSQGNGGLGAADGGEASAAPADVRLPQRGSAAAGLR
jgi:hypothetical protein